MKSKPILTAFSFFSVTLLLCLMFFNFLKNGIHIPHVSFGNVTINEFYLILDKKLNMRIENIIVNPTQDEKSQAIDQEALRKDIRLVLRIIKNAKFILDIFDEISVKKITVDDFVGELVFKDRMFRVNVPTIRAAINFHDNVDFDLLQIHIDELTHIPTGATLTGLIDYNLDYGTIDFQSAFSWGKEFVLNTIIRSDFKTFDIEGHSNTFSSFSFLKELAANWPKEAKEWLFDRVQGSLKLSKISWRGSFAMSDILKSIEENLFVDFKIKDAKVLYHDDLSPVLIKDVDAIFSKGKLHVALKEPTYEKIPLTGSYLELINLFNDDYLTLTIDIFTNTKLEAMVHRILKAYDIEIPLNQKNSRVNAHVRLEIPFGRDGIDVFGDFRVKNALFDLKGLDLTIVNAEIFLKNNRVACSGAEVYLKNIVDAKSRLSLIIDTDQKSVEGLAKLDHLFLEASDELLSLPQVAVPFTGDFSGKDFTLQLPSLQTHFLFGDRMIIIADDLSALYPYSSLLQDYGISSGELRLTSNDKGEIKLQGLAGSHNLPIKKLDGTSLSPVHVQGKIKNGDFEVWTQEDLIRIASQNNAIDINVQNLIFSLKSDQADNDSKNSSKNTPSKAVKINGKSLMLEIGSRRLFADEMALALNQKGSLSGTLRNKKTIFQISYYDGLLSVFGDNINSYLVNDFLQQKAFEGGNYTLLGEYQGGVFKGNIMLRKVTIRNLLGVQNVIAFIDTIPSLIMFKAPGFDEHGYKIESGTVDFEVTPEYFRIEKFQLSGSSIDSEGAGTLNLNDETLNFLIKISAFKAWKTIIDNTPLVGYVITGENGSFSTFMTITGNLEDPDITIDLSNKIIKAPAILIERTIKTPIKLFERLFKK